MYEVERNWFNVLDAEDGARCRVDRGTVLEPGMEKSASLTSWFVKGSSCGGGIVALGLRFKQAFFGVWSRGARRG